MLGTLEKNIKLKVIVIYVIVAVICGGMIIYIFKLRTNINDQKENINQYYSELSLIDSLIKTVDKAQSEVNLYVSTKRPQHYAHFNESLNNVEKLIDSLKHTNPILDEKLQQISYLLVNKGKIVSNLNKQFNSKNPIESINEVLREIAPRGKKDTLLVSTTIQDTIVYSGARKGFWRKFADLFSSSDEGETVTTVSTAKLDTLTLAKNDSINIVTEIAEQVKDDYAKHIVSIEKNLNGLIMADQEISSQLTTLLIELHSQTAQARLTEIQQSEHLIRNNNIYSVISSAIALILILILVMLIINDVNKSYTLRKDLEEANAKIQQIMDSRHKLLLSVSHDIKTPLNSILGILELKSETRELETQEIRTMKNSGGYVLALLNNLLEFSSIEQGTSRLSNQSFNLYDLCKEVADMFIPLARNKGLTITYIFDFDEELSLTSDPLKIKQILINILSNSVKYTVSGTVDFEVNYTDGKLLFTIQDTGAGIPQDQTDTIFLPFYRIEKNSHLSEGAGFGLFVVKGLIDLFEGNIQITSEVGKGTKTQITIPAQEIQLDTSFYAKKILVIDDDASYLLIIKDMLSNLGHIPTTCNTLDEFEKQLPQLNDYDEILTDMEMENFNGVDVLNMVKQNEINTPVSIITARDDMGSDDFKTMGFKAYIRKPVSISDLKQLFGGNNANGFDINSLNSFFENDSEALDEVLTAFASDTIKHLNTLRTAVFSEDFKVAQFVCHKMLPMFMQIHATDVLDVLKKVDSQRSQDSHAYPEWESDILLIIEYAEKIIEQIENVS